MVTFIEKPIPSLAPLTANPGDLVILNRPLRELLTEKLAANAFDVTWRTDFFPSGKMLAELKGHTDFVVENGIGEELARAGRGSEVFPADGVEIRYPWDVLAISETLVKNLDADAVEGIVSPRAEYTGHLVLGEGSVILPGVYIEGNVIIGKNCKIGPNCYIRGNTVIGDFVHIGQAVEIKNSIIGSHSAVGHLSYAGDSILGDHVNFGAGTIIGNLRHDGANHRSMVNGELVDTMRRKFGAVIGDHVHTGIHTSIYPGRKISAGASTRPGEIVSRDL